MRLAKRSRTKPNCRCERTPHVFIVKHPSPDTSGMDRWFVGWVSTGQCTVTGSAQGRCCEMSWIDLDRFSFWDGFLCVWASDTDWKPNLTMEHVIATFVQNTVDLFLCRHSLRLVTWGRWCLINDLVEIWLYLAPDSSERGRRDGWKLPQTGAGDLSHMFSGWFGLRVKNTWSGAILWPIDMAPHWFML